MPYPPLLTSIWGTTEAIYEAFIFEPRLKTKKDEGEESSVRECLRRQLNVTTQLFEV